MSCVVSEVNVMYQLKLIFVLVLYKKNDCKVMTYFFVAYICYFLSIVIVFLQVRFVSNVIFFFFFLPVY